MRNGSRIALLLLCCLLLIPLRAVADDGGRAREISQSCTVSAPNHDDLDAIMDRQLGHPVTLLPDEPVSITWKDHFSPCTVCFSWSELPSDATLYQYDALDQLLSSQSLTVTQYDCRAAVLPEAKRLVLNGSAPLAVDRIAVFEAGELPEPYCFDWEPTPDRLDYLLIATHPDDDILFMGVLHPLFGQEQGYAGTTAFVTTPSRKRVYEALRGLWADGGRIYPIFLGFHDVSKFNREKLAYLFEAEDVTLAIVRILRQYRPLVVFTHDVNGEYGHWQHVVVSQSVRDACALAADPSYDPASAESFGVWQVQKCYLHLWSENSFRIDMNLRIASMGNRKLLRIAQDAYKKHESQQNGNHEVNDDGEKYAPNRFGMAYGVVPAGDGPFDNIDETLFSFYVSPTPEPTAIPTDTPEPTAVPTDTPIPTAVPTDTPEPTAVPTDTPEPTAVETEIPQTEEPAAEPIGAQDPSRKPGKANAWAIAAVTAVLIIVTVVWIKRRKNTD